MNNLYTVHSSLSIAIIINNSYILFAVTNRRASSQLLLRFIKINTILLLRARIESFII